MNRKGKWNSFLFTLFGFQKTRGKGHLFVIILIHTSAWLLFLLLPLMFYPVRFDDKSFVIWELSSKLLPIGLFYLNYYFFLPAFFEKKKFGAYFTIILASLMLVLATDILIRERFFNRGPRMIGLRTAGNFADTGSERKGVFFFSTESGDHSFSVPPPPFAEKTILGVPGRIILFTTNRTISVCLFLLVTSSFIRLAFSFLKNQNEKKILENANLNAEVNFLKSQINPHFLFNTLNGIYSQAHNKSEHTEYSILKLSELLRYVLYESGEDKVPLEKDIQYISNYIDLQRLRLSSKVAIHYSVSDLEPGNFIAPLLLISFIENAFKHGISYTQSSVVLIDIAIFEKTLTLRVENPVIKNNTFTEGGLGLKNVTRRLQLLYPSKHSLNIRHTEAQYIINLKIDLTSD